ncbi:hypothetical protein LOTGIDRAFT_155733 [Lottia gigantea]|uniref:Dendritic cell-specific transmembrane protein-like domain-containing protein n=1 Tax=Lottia gigantea TaxID=225164 RepID=V3ZPD8_LOTGI|nr:hypothetical protein LOTGIDRAFT_155733 [Lottia gigantea]ESO82716.1 hypothetical protein LOTGIDRAFT_155733 [Lottia gigantea]
MEKELLKYSDGKNSRLKALFGVLAGIVLGAAIFLAMYYSFHYDILVSSIITGVSTILLAIGLAISTRCRCIVLLVFPSLATGKGRAAFLFIITGLLLMGPITNITNNSSQVAISMACITELAYNQSQALQDRLQEPVRSLREQIQRGVSEVTKYGEELDKAFKVLEDGIDKAEKTASIALDTVKDLKNKCEGRVNSGFSKCQRDSRRIQADCKKVLDPISDTVSKGVNGFVRGVSRVFGKRRRRRRSFYSSTRPTLLKRRKRGVCDVFNVGDTICGGFKYLGVCNVVTIPGNLVSGIFNGIRSVIDAYSNLFEVGVRNSGNIDSNANSSQSAAQIVDNVRSELTDKLDMATYFITILTRIMSTSIVLLIINAFLYDKRYKSKLSFDNLYITRYFKEIDGKRRAEHKKSILPLKKNERKMYTDTRAIKLSVAEKVKCKMGIAQVLLHSVITIMVILFDYLLHFTLYLLNKHGDVRLTFTGESNVNIQITGSGLMAQLFKILANDISIAQAYNSTINIDVCLPQPTEPDQSQIFLFAVLYVVALFFVIMQGYGQRLLHAIAAYFYPEREQQRVNYLYRKILVKRKTFILEAKQLILSNTVDDERKSSSKLPKCFKRLPCCRNNSVQTCTNCEEHL